MLTSGAVLKHYNICIFQKCSNPTHVASNINVVSGVKDKIAKHEETDTREFPLTERW